MEGLVPGGPRRRAVLRTLMASVATLAAASVLADGASKPDSAAVGAPAAVQAGAQFERPVGFSRIVAKVKPAVIGVRVKVKESPQAFGDELPSDSPLRKFVPHRSESQSRPTFGTALGSGFFISSDGYAVTNNHVIENASKIEVTTDDGGIHSAKLIGTDAKTDIAVIRVEGDNYPFVKFADAEPEIGDWVLAMGNPFGLGGTVTAGIVSGRGRHLGTGSSDDFIQIDAPVNKGNSGGPTFDVNGEVIGINTAIFSPSGGFIGIAFDVAAEDAKPVVQQLKQTGTVSRGWIGVKTQTVSPQIASSLGLRRASGALVAESLAGSPAQKAGIQTGDIIASVDGTDIKDTHDLGKKVSAKPPGQAVTLGVIRKGESKDFEVKIGRAPTAQAPAPSKQPGSQSKELGSQTNLGLTMVPARSVAGAGHEGVVVTQIDPEGDAADAGILTGDVIVDINGRTVSNATDVREAVLDARSQTRGAVLLRLKSGGETRFIAVPTG